MQAPVRARLAKKLIAVAQPARFGRGEQTLTDTFRTLVAEPILHAPVRPHAVQGTRRPRAQ